MRANHVVLHPGFVRQGCQVNVPCLDPKELLINKLEFTISMILGCDNSDFQVGLLRVQVPCFGDPLVGFQNKNKLFLRQEPMFKDNLRVQLARKVVKANPKWAEPISRSLMLTMLGLLTFSTDRRSRQSRPTRTADGPRTSSGFWQRIHSLNSQVPTQKNGSFPPTFLGRDPQGSNQNHVFFVPEL